MKIRGYTLLGWLTWQGIKTVGKRMIGRNKAKLGAAATVLLVLIGGIAAARASGGDAEE
jgi:hypothetical protein